MELLVFLLVMVGVIFTINLYITRFDVWNPSNLFFIFWFVSIISTINLMEVYKLKINTLFLLILMIGLFCFFLGFNVNIFNKIDKNKIFLDSSFLINRNYYFTNIVIFLLITILGYIAINYNLSQIGLVAVNEIAESSNQINSYRLSYLEGDIQAPFYIRQINRFIEILGYYIVYDFAQRLILKKHNINIFLSIFIIGIIFVNILLQAARTSIVYLIIAFFIYFNILYIRQYRRCIPLRNNMIIGIIVIALLLGFGLMGVIMGRPGQEEPLLIVCRYFATGIMNLNYVSGIDSFYPSHLIGEASFGGIWRCINDYIININYDYNQEFNFYNGYSLGNTYTGFYKYYSDFGFLGIIIFPIIIGQVFSRIYSKLINREITFIQIILFGYLVKGLVLFSYDELLISTQISFGLFCDIIYIFLIKFCFFRERYNIRCIK